MSTENYDKVEMFLHEHAVTRGEDPNRFQLSQSKREALAKDFGITKETLDKVAAFEVDVHNGAVQFTTKKLAKAIEAAKKSGDDPKECSIELTMYTKSGPDRYTQSAVKMNNDPKNPGQQTTSYGAVRMSMVRKRTISDSLMASVSEQIKKALG